MVYKYILTLHGHLPKYPNPAALPYAWSAITTGLFPYCLFETFFIFLLEQQQKRNGQKKLRSSRKTSVEVCCPTIATTEPRGAHAKPTSDLRFLIMPKQPLTFSKLFTHMVWLATTHSLQPLGRCRTKLVITRLFHCKGCPGGTIANFL